MTAPKEHPFPPTRPTIHISKLESEPFVVACRELYWWFAVPEVGDHTYWATYDSPDWSLTTVAEMKAMGKARIHDVECVKVSVAEWENGSWQLGAGTIYGRLTEAHVQWLAYVDSRAEPEVVRTFLDAGLFRVSVGGNDFICLRVLHVEEAAGERGILMEGYLTETGRTVLCRRYNGRHWQGGYRGLPFRHGGRPGLTRFRGATKHTEAGAHPPPCAALPTE